MRVYSSPNINRTSSAQYKLLCSLFLSLSTPASLQIIYTKLLNVISDYRCICYVILKFSKTNIYHYNVCPSTSTPAYTNSKFQTFIVMKCTKAIQMWLFVPRNIFQTFYKYSKKKTFSYPLTHLKMEKSCALYFEGVFLDTPINCNYHSRKTETYLFRTILTLHQGLQGWQPSE